MSAWSGGGEEECKERARKAVIWEGGSGANGKKHNSRGALHNSPGGGGVLLFQDGYVGEQACAVVVVVVSKGSHSHESCSSFRPQSDPT